jgi:hypothetical protein
MVSGLSAATVVRFDFDTGRAAAMRATGRSPPRTWPVDQPQAIPAASGADLPTHPGQLVVLTVGHLQPASDESRGRVLPPTVGQVYERI